MAFNLTGFEAKALNSCVVGGAVAAAAFVLYRIYERFYKDDEYLQYIPEHKVKESRKIVVFGLPGSGKTSFSAAFSRKGLDSEPDGTVSLFVLSRCLAGTELYIWDTGSNENTRHYWVDLLYDADIIVYVVDSTDIQRFPHARRDLHSLLQYSNAEHIPLLVVASKQDKPDAVEPEVLLEFMNLDGFKHKHHIKVVGVQVPWGQKRKGIYAAYKFFKNVHLRNPKRLA